MNTALQHFEDLPDNALIEVRTIALLFGCSTNTIWRRAKSGLLPAPIKVSPQQTRWRVGDIRGALNALESQRVIR